MDEGEARHSKTMSNEKHFAVCVRNDEYEGALELRKIYEVLEDPDAEPHDLVRVIDESGEDYLYPRLPTTVVSTDRASTQHRRSDR
jgi:hypothetical protein